jgi:hypothetical protein
VCVGLSLTRVVSLSLCEKQPPRRSPRQRLESA